MPNDDDDDDDDNNNNNMYQIYFVCFSIEKESPYIIIIIIIIIIITVVIKTRASNLLLYSFETERTPPRQILAVRFDTENSLLFNNQEFVSPVCKLSHTSPTWTSVIESSSHPGHPFSLQ